MEMVNQAFCDNMAVNKIGGRDGYMKKLDNAEF